MKNNNKHSSGRLFGIILAIVLGIVIIALAVVYFFFDNTYGLSNYISDEKVLFNVAAMQETELDVEPVTEFDYSTVQTATDEQLTGTFSVLLVGSDRRNSDEYGNSDAMILATFNHNVKKIFMVSFMRDLYADIPDVGIRKLNNAYAVGGGPLLCDTLRTNYGVRVNNYIAVDFNSLSKIVDAVGGVDITCTDDEAIMINDYITSTEDSLDVDDVNDYLLDGGATHLNGVQATAYARIRYIGNGDFERTSRQRRVILGVVDRCKNMSVSELSSLVLKVLPLVTHNVSRSELLDLISQLPTLLSYKLITDRIPYDGMYSISNEILIPDMDDTIAKLHGEIYAIRDNGEEDEGLQVMTLNDENSTLMDQLSASDEAAAAAAAAVSGEDGTE